MVSVCLILSVGLVVIDQLIKHWAYTDLQAVGTIPLIQDVLHLTYSENRGAAFSILYGKTELLMIVNTILIFVLLYLLIAKKVTHPLGMGALTLMIAGGVGNMVDRLMYAEHFVVDYIDFRLINFAIFNFADMCVVCGVGLMMIYYLFIEGREEQKLLDTEKAENEGSESHD